MNKTIEKLKETVFWELCDQCENQWCASFNHHKEVGCEKYSNRLKELQK